jgi:soluble lytic murein transglycosylase-like protein
VIKSQSGQIDPRFEKSTQMKEQPVYHKLPIWSFQHNHNRIKRRVQVTKKVPHLNGTAMFVFCALVVFKCSAEQSIRVYQYTQQNGVPVYADRAPLKQPYRLLKYDCYACRPASTVDWQHTPLFLQHYHDSIYLAANTHDLEPALIRAVIHAESGFQPKAQSRKGAKGLMQLMPETARRFGVENSFDSHQNIQAGSAYLAALLTEFNGDQNLALAAYNAGPATVRKYAGVPPYDETRAYLKRVQLLLQRYREQQA